MRVSTILLLGTLMILPACGLGGPAPSTGATTGAVQVTPTFYDYNVTCADLGYAEELKVDQGAIATGSWGTYTQDGLEVQVFTADRKHFDWAANLGIDAVIIKASDGANVYAYDPESLGDTGLVTPTNASGQPADISHINFCFDWEVTVAKTAETSFHRGFTWQIQKDTAADPTLLLAMGQTYLMPYTVAVWSNATDSDWAASGVITIGNPSSRHSANLAGVTDEIAGGIAAPVDCGVTFPYVLGPLGTLTCTYATPLPDGTDRLNTATVAVTAQSPVGGNTGTADVRFGEPTSQTDECVDVDDDQAGFLGTTCSDTTFAYTLPIGPYQTCGEHVFLNLATFTTNDTGTQGWENATVVIDVACEGEGCTLTPGYWKTHSEHGPAPYDDTWAQLPAGADTAFFLSGQSWHDVLWTPPRGNSYYILAHAWIAAYLNGLNGADGTDVDTELAAGEQILATYTPAEIGSLRKNSALRAEVIALAGVLDAYNNGIVGPGHCSE